MRKLKKDVGWPRYMKKKRLKSGAVAYYWQPHRRDILAGFTLHSEPLGRDFPSACERATKLNMHLDAWRRGDGGDVEADSRFGTVDWWIESYFRSEAFTKLSGRSQRDYRRGLQKLADIPTKIMEQTTGRILRVGELPASSLTGCS